MSTEIPTPEHPTETPSLKDLANKARQARIQKEVEELQKVLQKARTSGDNLIVDLPQNYSSSRLTKFGVTVNDIGGPRHIIKPIRSIPPDANDYYRQCSEALFNVITAKIAELEADQSAQIRDEIMEKAKSLETNPMFKIPGLSVERIPKDLQTELTEAGITFEDAVERSQNHVVFRLIL